MDNKITIKDVDGREYVVDVIDIFNVKEYEGKEYIVYTLGREVDKNNLEVYVSILKQNGKDYSLDYIEDEKEWEIVQRAMDEMGEV